MPLHQVQRIRITYNIVVLHEWIWMPLQEENVFFRDCRMTIESNNRTCQLVTARWRSTVSRFHDTILGWSKIRPRPAATYSADHVRREKDAWSCLHCTPLAYSLCLKATLKERTRLIPAQLIGDRSKLQEIQTLVYVVSDPVVRLWLFNDLPLVWVCTGRSTPTGHNFYFPSRCCGKEIALFNPWKAHTECLSRGGLKEQQLCLSLSSSPTHLSTAFAIVFQ